MSKAKKDQIKEQILDQDAFKNILDRTFNSADLNKNNYVEMNEFAALLKSIYATLGLPSPSNSDIEQELKRLDKNGDKRLSKQEFKILVRDLCLFFLDKSN